MTRATRIEGGGDPMRVTNCLRSMLLALVGAAESYEEARESLESLGLDLMGLGDDPMILRDVDQRRVERLARFSGWRYLIERLLALPV